MRLEGRRLGWRPAASLAVALWLLGSATGAGKAPVQTAQPAAKTMRVLFLGNSFTYFHNMPVILETLAPNVETRLVAQGGLTLQAHWENAETRKLVAEEQWDYVVLQEQSSLAETFVVNGVSRVNSDQIFRTHAEKWIRAIQAAGAKPVLNMHWKRKEAPARDQEFLDFAFVRAAKEWGARLAPVSMAWREAQRRGAALYDADGLHPSPAGSYLEACVMYVTLFGRSPVGLPAEAHGPEIEKSNGKVLGGKVELARLREAEARTLQESAWKAQQDLASGKVPRRHPAQLEVPKLSTGDSISTAALEGTWRGPLRVYPFPATLELRFKQNGNELSVEGVVLFGGKPDDIRFSDATVKLGRSAITFEDPKGPNGGIVRYKAALRNGELQGIAEILITQYPVYLIGEWNGKRQ